MLLGSHYDIFLNILFGHFNIPAHVMTGILNNVKFGVMMLIVAVFLVFYRKWRLGYQLKRLGAKLTYVGNASAKTPLAKAKSGLEMW